MAKDSHDLHTLDFLQPARRGRPRKPDAKPVAQRMREYRARLKAASLAVKG